MGPEVFMIYQGGLNERLAKRQRTTQGSCRLPFTGGFSKKLLSVVRLDKRKDRYKSKGRKEIRGLQ